MKPITHIKCIEPFLLFGIHNQGECFSCCPVWSKAGSVGRLTEENSIMDLWNGEKMQYIRQALLDDRLGEICNFEYCPYAIKKEYLDLEAIKYDDSHYIQIIDQIIAGKTVLDNPPYTLFLANSEQCNLRCTMCDTRHQYPESDRRLDEILFSRIIPEILPGISRIFMSGNGEALFNRYSRKFLQTLDSSRYPQLRIRLLTNGILFTPELWKSISHNHYENISVSMDAATQKTYEKIRVNGNWDTLLKNLEFISRLRRQNIFTHFCVTFVVLKSNYREMKKFVELSLQLGADRIVFQKVFGRAYIRENINLTKNKKVFAEIGKSLADPIFNRPEVDTTMIDEYRNFVDKKFSLADQILTKRIEWGHFTPKL